MAQKRCVSWPGLPTRILPFPQFDQPDLRDRYMCGLAAILDEFDQPAWIVRPPAAGR